MSNRYKAPNLGPLRTGERANVLSKKSPQARHDCNGFGHTVIFILLGQAFGLVCYHIYLSALCLAFKLLFSSLELIYAICACGSATVTAWQEKINRIGNQIEVYSMYNLIH